MVIRSHEHAVCTRLACALAVLASGCTDLGGPVPDAAPEPDAELPETDGGAIVDVAMAAMQFVPKDLEVPSGTTVRWTNYDFVAHSATAGRPYGGTQAAWDSGLFGLGQTWQATFVDPGEVPYYCKTHLGMTGTVDVR